MYGHRLISLSLHISDGAQFDEWTSLPWTAAALLLPLEVEEDPWPICWELEWGILPLFENVEPTEPVELLIEDIRLENASLLDPDKSSGLKSDDDDDGAKVPIEDPTG